MRMDVEGLSSIRRVLLYKAGDVAAARARQRNQGQRRRLVLFSRLSLNSIGSFSL